MRTRTQSTANYGAAYETWKNTFLLPYAIANRAAYDGAGNNAGAMARVPGVYAGRAARQQHRRDSYRGQRSAICKSAFAKNPGHLHYPFEDRRQP